MEAGNPPWLAVLMSKVSASRVAAGAGHLGLSAGSLALLLRSHASLEFVLAICGAGVLLATAAAAVAIVEVRTNRAVESRRMAALTKLARKHPDSDRAMRLLLAEPLSATANSSQAAKLVKFLRRSQKRLR